MSKESQSVKDESSVNQLENLLVYGSSYADARLNRLKSSVRESVINLSTQVSFVFLGITTLLVAISFFMYGIATGLGQAMGGRLWLGFVIVGAGAVLIKLLVSKILHSQVIKVTEIRRKNLTKQENVSVAEFIQASRQLKEEVSQVLDVKKWTEEYPFYATGAAAVTGFVVAGGIRSQDTETKVIQATMDQSAFMTMLVGLAEDVLKETVVPPVKEYIASFLKENADRADQAY